MKLPTLIKRIAILFVYNCEINDLKDKSGRNSSVIK